MQKVSTVCFCVTYAQVTMWWSKPWYFPFSVVEEAWRVHGALLAVFPPTMDTLINLILCCCLWQKNNSSSSPNWAQKKGINPSLPRIVSSSAKAQSWRSSLKLTPDSPGQVNLIFISNKKRINHSDDLPDPQAERRAAGRSLIEKIYGLVPWHATHRQTLALSRCSALPKVVFCLRNHTEIAVLSFQHCLGL